MQFVVGEVTKHVAHLAAEALVAHAPDAFMGATAVAALVVAVLEQRHAGVGWPVDVVTLQIDRRLQRLAAHRHVWSIGWR